MVLHPPESGPRFLVGAASWSDRSLVRDGHFYPRPSMRAAERLAHYAARLPLAEISATRFYPPTEDVLARWAAQTPPGFTFDVQAWSLLSGAAALPGSLWADLHDEVKPEARDKPRLYLEHLSADGLAECWLRFRSALGVLHRAGRLGAVVLHLPHWAKPGRTSAALLGQARAALDGWPVAVELGNHRWHEGEQAEETLALLEDLELSLVCVDRAEHPTHSPPLLGATTGLAVVRPMGRRTGRWSWPWRYDEHELDQLAALARRVGEGCDVVHVVCANTHADDAVVAALGLLERLAPAPGQLALF